MLDAADEESTVGCVCVCVSGCVRVCVAERITGIAKSSTMKKGADCHTINLMRKNQRSGPIRVKYYRSFRDYRESHRD